MTRLAGPSGGVSGDGVVRVGGAEVMEAAVMAGCRRTLTLGSLAGASTGEAWGNARGAPAAAQVGGAGGASAAVAPISEQIEHCKLGAAQLCMIRWLRSRHPPWPAQTGS